MARARSFEVEPERDSFFGHDAAADALDRRDHAALTAKQAVGKRDDADIRRGGRRSKPQRLRDGLLVAVRVKRADAGERARSRTADAGEAVHHQRRAPIPIAHEIEKVGDMRLVGQDAAFERQGNIMQPQPQMILWRDAFRPFDLEFVAEQRHDVASADPGDGLLQAGKRADVNSGIPYHGISVIVQEADGCGSYPVPVGTDGGVSLTL